MLTQLFSALLALSVAQAAPAHLHHAHIKREVVYETVTVIAGAATSAATSAASASSVANAVATSAAASSSDAYVAASSVASASDSASSSASTAVSASAGTVEYYAEQGKGITYSPYTDTGSCKDTDTITSDIELLADFDLIRVYAPDCNCVSAIMGAMGDSQKLFAGVYYYDSISTDLSTLATQVTASSQGWDGVYAVAIGNEWVNSGTYSASTVASAVSSARSTLSGLGFTGYVVTVDTLVAYEANTELCDASDFVACNSHAYWDGSVLPENAGTWLAEQIASVKSACGGDKDVLVTETGWPTQGDTYGVAVPSTANQLAAIKSISEEVADQVLFFTTYNDLWKEAGSYGVEQYWGIFSS